MMSRWRPCIVTFVDVIGIKKLAQNGTAQASNQMRELHQLTASQMKDWMPKHSHAYAWNDSVLLLGYLEEGSATEILQEANGIKNVIEQRIGRCYAISVKGQSFPETTSPPAAGCEAQILQQPRTTVIKASSYALANCFQIEAALGKTHRADWYVDERLKKAIVKPPRNTKPVNLLPRNKTRSILLFDGSLY